MITNNINIGKNTIALIPVLKALIKGRSKSAQAATLALAIRIKELFVPRFIHLKVKAIPSSQKHPSRPLR
tara:strand:- start:1765 stop:1974 length:210 start_codon:yes stop_codon:yes gene_type:complete